MGYKASNNADTTLSESITTTSTAINVATGHGDDFPALGATDWTLITITDKNGAREIIKIIARSGDTMTVGTTPGGAADVGGRAQEGTTALSITYTDDHSVRCGPTAGLIEAMADYSDQGDLTATPAEIDVLHDSGVTNADLVKLHAVTSEATELSEIHESGVTNADLVILHDHSSDLDGATSTPTANKIAKFNSDGIMKGAELNMTDEASATGTTTTTTLGLGTVTAGDRIFVTAKVGVASGSAAYAEIGVEKSSGTATVQFVHNDSKIVNRQPIVEGQGICTVSGVIKVTGSGTLVIRSYTLSGTVYYNQIYAFFLKKT